MYLVVFRTIVECPTNGAITWTSFESKERFDAWYDQKMRSWYEVVEEGVTQERALGLVASPEATAAVMSSLLRQINETCDEIVETASAIVAEL